MLAMIMIRHCLLTRFWQLCVVECRTVTAGPLATSIVVLQVLIHLVHRHGTLVVGIYYLTTADLGKGSFLLKTSILLP